ncbi:MAG TPA: enoyl-CoA hydratase/isomerase family protein, partial [Thermoplasmata archaeon]|nr:enoyl-CoA hydratase/isomerase family protein [Thermoplasmata archaeon]
MPPGKPADSSTHLDVEVLGAVTRIRLNRPDRLNAFDVPMLRTLRDMLEDVATDRSVRAVILTGAGGAFCA